MKIAIYTSFAVNYLAKARVMAHSVKKLNPDIDVIALVSDRFPADIAPEEEPFDHIWMVEDYPDKNINGWIFRHNIMELCTAVKGWALQRLLKMGYDYVMYFDPDAWALADPALIVGILPPTKSVAVVPHTTYPATTEEQIRLIETSSLRHGIYNLGFLLVKNDENGNILADWWAKRLDRFCVDDFENGLFTDQRWFDLAVGYFSFIEISHHAGIDVASWNVGQRKVVRKDEAYEIDGDPLIFYHFSGVGPAGIHRWVREKFAPSDPLVAELEFEYERLLEEQGQSKLVKIKPFFDTYPDRTPITKAERALYRNHPTLAKEFADPYDIAHVPNYRAAAKPLLPAAQAESQIVADSLPASFDAARLFHAATYKRETASPHDDLQLLWQAYVAAGWNGTSRPNLYFDTEYYVRFVSEEDKALYPTPLHHYAQKGFKSAISPIWIYDEAYYLETYPDILDAVRDGVISCGFEHFSSHGWHEGRSGCAFFNEKDYLARYQDVAKVVESGGFLTAEQHYLHYGRLEGRTP